MSESVDELLLPLVRGPERESDQRLERLINEHAQPIIKGILNRKLRSHSGNHHSLDESEDLQSEVVVQLLARLRTFISNPNEHAIRHFRGYVAVTTYNACHLYLRQKFPARWRLKNRLRYALTKRKEFALEQDDEGEWFCGPAGSAAAMADSAEGITRLNQIAEDPNVLRAAGLPAANVPDAELTELIQAVFSHVRAPVKLDDLLGVIADLRGVHDSVVNVTSSDEQDFEAAADDSNVVPDFAAEVERRSYLRRLWSEISQLPILQRTALLLNLRDLHEGVIILLPLAGIASVRQIAQAVEMSEEKFAGLWSELPLEDSVIAGLLGLTRQQVINLRKAARARLARRMQVNCPKGAKERR